jgi:hypothetical protein
LIFKEGYSNYHLANPGDFPNSVYEPLLKDSYPSTGSKNVSSNNYSDIWWHYPIFKLGSYAQITNNIKYSRNPDDGECRTAEFCGALYKDHEIQSNISKPLPPAPEINNDSVRVGYYLAPNNLFLGGQDGPQLQTF